MADVFVSYASEDRARIRPIVEAIEQAGFTVWMDRRIGIGASFDREIERELAAAACVVVVWSEHSIESDWVRNEAQEGLDRGVLVPILIDNVRPPLAFRRAQAAQLSDRLSEDELGRQPQVLSQVLGVVYRAISTDLLKRTGFTVASGAKTGAVEGVRNFVLMAGGGQSSVYDPLHTVQYSLEEMKAAVEAAADWGTYVMVHAYTDEAVVRSIGAGVKVIEHGHLITEKTAKLMAKEGIWLSTQANFADPSPEAADMILEQFGPVTYEKFKQVRDGFAAAITFAKKYGVKVAWGTDNWGPNLTRVPVEWGMRANFFTNHEQLVQATSQNGELLALTGILNPYSDGKIGVIEVGAYADIILVDGNPLEDILVMQEAGNIELVMKDGKILKNTL